MNRQEGDEGHVNTVHCCMTFGWKGHFLCGCIGRGTVCLYGILLPTILWTVLR